MPVNRKDIAKITEWCETKKKEKQRIYIIERNPFKDEMDWTRAFTAIEIDRPKEIASKTSLVYDSTTKSLWRYLNNTWRRVESDVRVE